MTETTLDPTQILLLTVDQRIDFCRDLVGASDEPSAAEREQAASLKRVVFDGLIAAIEDGVAKSQAAIWADQDLGEGVLLRARAMSLATAASVEKPSGNASVVDPLRIWDAVTRLDATYVAARVDYNPGDSLPSREEQRAQLRTLTEKCREGGRRLLLELAPVPTEAQSAELGDESTARTVLLLEGMRQLQDAGVDPAVWVIEPPEDAKIAATIAAQAHVDDRTGVTVLFTVGGEVQPDHIAAGPSKSERAMARLAARTLGVGGLLIGPQAYIGRLAQLNQGVIGHDDAVSGIASHIQKLWELFLGARRTTQVK